MALEFECPFCKATIRVPDHAAGKRGRCPQCATKLSVPKLGQARRAGEAQPFFPPAPDSIVPSPPENDAGVVFQEYDANDGMGIDPQVAAQLPPGDIALPALTGPLPPPLPSPVRHLPDSLLSRSKARRRTPAWVWVIIVVLLLGVGGAAGALYWYQMPIALTGELEGKLVDNPPLPPAVVSKSLLELPPDDVDGILSHLERNPATLVSGTGLATVLFQGSERGLLVSVQPGSATSLYRVEVKADKKLRKFLHDRLEDYDRIHHEDLSVAVNQMFRIIKSSLKSKQTSSRDLQEFRDRVGFAAPVRGLGHFVAAAHRKQIYPCVAEDEEALYFLLPPGVKRFQIRGKAVKRGVPFFPGEFDVTVAGSIMLPQGDEPETKPEKPMNSSEEPESALEE